MDFTTAIGSVHWRGYGFDQRWEIVPGVWTIEIWQGDRKLLEHSFTIGPQTTSAVKHVKQEANSELANSE